MIEVILDDSYKLQEEIGKGGFGAVYRAIRIGSEDGVGAAEGVGEVLRQIVDGGLVAGGAGGEVLRGEEVEIAQDVDTGGAVADVGGFEEEAGEEGALEAEAPALGVRILAHLGEGVHALADVGEEATGGTERLGDAGGKGVG